MILGVFYLVEFKGQGLAFPVGYEFSMFVKKTIPIGREFNTKYPIMIENQVSLLLHFHHLVDALLAFILMVGGVIGAQFGARAGQSIASERLRLLLGGLVLLVGLRFAYQLVVRPDDLFSIRQLGGV